MGWSASRAARAQRRAYRRKDRTTTTSLIPYIASTWEKFQIDLEAALAKAYYGPLFTPDVDCEYPEAFEAEERSRLNGPGAEVDDAVIMQLVSGRQLLGDVRVVPTVTASMEPFAHYTCKALLLDRLKQHFLPDPLGDQSIFQHIVGARRPAPHAATPPALPVLELDALEMTWFGRTVARATRFTDTKRHGQATIVFEVNRAISAASPSPPEAAATASAAVNDHFEVVATLLSSPRGSAIAQSRAQNILLDADGEETHSVIRHATPGVHSLW